MKSIRRQMLIYLMLGGGIIFTVLVVVSIMLLGSLPAHMKAQYQEISNARADEVSKELIGILDSVKMVSQSPVIKSMDMEEIKEYLPSLVLGGKYRNMTIADLDGLAWSTLDQNLNISQQEQYQKIV